MANRLTGLSAPDEIGEIGLDTAAESDDLLVGDREIGTPGAVVTDQEIGGRRHALVNDCVVVAAAEDLSFELAEGMHPLLPVRRRGPIAGQAFLEPSDRVRCVEID